MPIVPMNDKVHNVSSQLIYFVQIWYHTFSHRCNEMISEQLLLAQCSVVLLSDCEGDVTIPQWMHDDASQLVMVES